MADNCYGITFTAYCPNGNEFTGDAGVYFAGLGMPLSGGEVNQADIAAGGQCSSLAGEHYETYTCPPLAVAPVTDSQIVQKRRIPPLGPKAPMRQATGERGICDTDKQLTLHSLSIGIGAVAGLYLIPNKFLGAVGGMVAGGVLGGLILNSACK